MATTNDLRDRVLYALNKLAPGQTPNHGMGVRATNAIDAEIAILARRNVINYINVAGMPEEDEEPIINLAAYRGRLSLGVSAERVNELRIAKDEAFQDLLANHAIPYDGSTLEANYY